MTSVYQGTNRKYKPNKRYKSKQNNIKLLSQWFDTVTSGVMCDIGATYYKSGWHVFKDIESAISFANDLIRNGFYKPIIKKVECTGILQTGEDYYGKCLVFKYMTILDDEIEGDING